MTKEELIKESETIKKEIEQLNGLKQFLSPQFIVTPLIVTHSDSKENTNRSKSFQSSFSDRKNLTF